MPRMRRKLRLTILISAASLGALVVALVVAAYVMLQPQRVTSLLRAQAHRAGLELTVSAPAQPALWPHPAVVLHGLTLSANNRPVLVAARARLVLPWHTLLGDSPAITRLELDTFQLDLGQLRKLVDQSPAKGPGHAFLPRINTGVLISHGSLVNNGTLLLDHLRMRTGALVSGKQFNLSLTATTPAGQPVNLALALTPEHKHDAVQLDHIQLNVNLEKLATLALSGQGQWRGGEKMQLALRGWLRRPPARRYAVAIELLPGKDGTPEQPRLHLAMTGNNINANGYLPPARLLAWWHETINGSPTSISLPPLTGSVYAKHVTLGNMRIDGLDIVTSPAPVLPDSKPAGAASAATPP